MTRNEIFLDFFSGGRDAAPMFETEYEQLRTLWECTPKELREETLDLLMKDAGIEGVQTLEELSPFLAKEDAKAVEQQYRYRLASQFADDLPDFFRRVLLLSDDIEMMDLLYFGTLATISSMLWGVRGSLLQERVLPNLYFFISGNAASGKGKVNLCRRLLSEVAASYASQFFIPANSTDTALYEELAANGGRGMIFETEADTLTAAFSKPSGKFSDGLRKAFHNEEISYMRRTDHERVKIPIPVISVLLTGTPGQVGPLFKSPENGLFSRFLFYRLGGHNESFVDDSEIHGDITGDKVNTYLGILSQMLSAFFFQLRQKAFAIGRKALGYEPDEPLGVLQMMKLRWYANYVSNTLTFRLTEDQNRRFLNIFHDETIAYRELFRRAYESDEAADYAEGIMRRMGNICYRMMMVLSVSRLIGTKGEIPDELVCDDRDFERVLRSVKVLQYHNAVHFDDLMVFGRTVQRISEEDVDTGDMLSYRQRRFFDALPDSFITQRALQIAEEVNAQEMKERQKGVMDVTDYGFSTSTAEKYLKRFCELGLIQRIHKGCYRKTSSNDQTQN